MGLSILLPQIELSVLSPSKVTPPWFHRGYACLYTFCRILLKTAELIPGLWVLRSFVYNEVLKSYLTHADKLWVRSSRDGIYCMVSSGLLWSIYLPMRIQLNLCTSLISLFQGVSDNICKCWVLKVIQAFILSIK